MFFLLLKLAFSWASTARISPPLLGSSSPSTCSVGTDAYRQKAILPTSYQASPEIYEGVDCKDDSPGCFTGAHNLSFAHTGTKIAEMIQRPYSHGPWKRHPVQAGARTSFERLCLAGDNLNRCDLHSRKRGRTLPALPCPRRCHRPHQPRGRTRQ